MAIAMLPQGSAMPSLFAFLDPSPTTLLILGVIAVLLFGERLPEVARSVGKGFMEFKKGVRSIQEDVEGAINSATSTDAAPRYDEPEEREEATAPKFEPPPSS
jgi:sec-independent protein translocase protein TatA